MSKKYIVKNCPAYLGADCVGFGNGGCDTCTDCPIKKAINKLIAQRDKAYWVAIALNAEQVLNLFDIQVIGGKA